MRSGSSSTLQSFLYTGLAALAMVALVVGLFRVGHRQAMMPASQRRAMPPVTLNLIDGKAWRLADHQGQVVAINYWASWCAPCWQETPMLVRLSQQLGSQGFALVGVAVDEHTSSEVPQGVRDFVGRLQVTYPIAITSPMSQMSYGMEGLPTTILVDRRGHVARTYVGALKESQFRADVEDLLRESPAPTRVAPQQR